MNLSKNGGDLEPCGVCGLVKGGGPTTGWPGRDCSSWLLVLRSRLDVDSQDYKIGRGEGWALLGGLERLLLESTWSAPSFLGVIRSRFG